MVIAERAAERSVRDARARAEAEVRAFIEAGLDVLRERGAAGLTVAEVLARAGRSTRAFYRHFESKDELLLAIYEHDAQASVTGLRDHIESAGAPRAALDAWIEATLRLAYEEPRARRTRVLASEGKRLQAEHPSEFGAILDAQLEPLVETLERGRADGTFPHADPRPDAATVHAIVWALVEDELRGHATMTAAEAKAHALRYCLPALGARADG
jgi:AcrR family transcriptional regulator